MIKLVFLFFIWLVVFLAGCKGQAYNYPPPPPPSSIEPLNRGNFTVPASTTATVVLDTAFTRWSHGLIHTLGSDNGIVWTTILEDREYGKMAKSDKYFFVVSLQFHHANGTQSSCDLIIDVLNINGSLKATSRKSNIVGYSPVSIVTAGDYAYFMFQEELTSSDRDLYVAKIDTNASVIWSTRIGKRFGTEGNGLIQIHPNGSVIAITNHYEPVFVDQLDTRIGVIQRTQRLEFPYDMMVKSFVINQSGHVVALATQDYYIGMKNYNSILLFELDNDFSVIRQQFFDTDLQDRAQDIVQRQDGKYIFLIKSKFKSQDYKEEYGIHILGVTDPNFKLIDQQSIEIEDDGQDSRITSDQNDIYLFQRSKKGFNLLVLNHDLKLQGAYTNKDGYRTPVFINIDNAGKISMGGYISNTWIAELDLSK
ncbi:MAG: hypothetical protein WBB31_08855 [Saprospiraceae bacterium]